MKVDWSSLKKTTEDDPGFAPEEPVWQSPAVEFNDSATGVTVHADKGVFDEGVQIVVTETAKGADYDITAASLSDVGKKFKLYNVKFLNKDGNEVSPNGTVAISFPVAEGYDSSKLALYRINDDGTKTLVKGAYEDGRYAVITRTGGASYALLETGSTVTDAQNTANVNGGTTSSPQTGDGSNIAVWFLLMIASAVMLGVSTLVRKRKFSEGK